jgi:hypothetical protein
MRKSNFKEIYTACLLLLIGVVYLAAQGGAFLSRGSTRVDGDIVQFSWNEMLSHLRSIITILLCFSGGILLLKIRRAGWIISQSLLLLLLTIATGIFISNMTALGILVIVLAAGILSLFLAITFLLQKPTREKFMVTWKTFLSSIVLYAILVAFYFLLQ